MDNVKVILASTSPYRKTLMETLGIPFETAKPLCDESKLKDNFTGLATDLCMHLAKHKALSLQKAYSNAIIIGSDQALIFSNQALGKGKTFEGSFKQLSTLSGKTAVLVTATYLYNQKGKDTFFECNTSLNFKDLSSQEITNYLKLDEPYDCAGSFKFEQNGHSLFSSVETADETAIQGLPLIQLKKELKLLTA